MKNSLLLILFGSFITFSGYGQEQFYTKTGTVSFKAGTAVEDVDGVNKSVSSIIDIKSGKLEMAMLIKGFEFKRGLMQEHFNENYMESEKFPKSTFKGKIAEIPGIDLTVNGTYKVNVVGTLEIHNTKKEVTIPAILKVENGVINTDDEFQISLEDFKIEIPAAVKDKISRTVAVHFTGEYKPFKRK